LKEKKLDHDLQQWGLVVFHHNEHLACFIEANGYRAFLGGAFAMH
jgi:hypothetical protein